MTNPVRNNYFWMGYLNNSTSSIFIPQDTYYTNDMSNKTGKELVIMIDQKTTFKNMRFMASINVNKIRELYDNDFSIFNQKNGDMVLSSTDLEPELGEVIKGLINTGASGTDVFPDKDKQSYIFYIKSASNNWLYVKTISNDKLFKVLNLYNRLVFLIIIIMLAISIPLSYCFSIKFYRPIKRIVDMIDFKGKKMNTARHSETQKIYDYIQHMYTDFQEYEQKYKKMYEIYKEYFYLLNISNSNPEENSNMLKDMDINLKDFNSFIAIYYELNLKPGFYEQLENNGDNYDNVIFLIKTLIDLSIENMNLKLYSFRIRHKSFFTIINLEKDEFNKKEFESTICNVLKNDMNYFYITFFISDIYHQINDLKTAYDDVINLCNYSSIKPETQFIYNNTVGTLKNYALPKPLADKLICMAENNKLAEINSTFCEILNYFDNNNVPVFHIKKNLVKIIDIIAGYFDKVISAKQEKLDNIYKRIFISSTRDEFQELLSSFAALLNEICSYHCKENTNHIIVEDMKKYITENYHSESLCLDFFSDKYRMSMFYLSKIFKDYSGVNFSDFLNMTRLENAKKLLLGSYIKIKEITSEVGFNDPNTFIKAFKKHYGLSPGEYRKSMLSRLD